MNKKGVLFLLIILLIAYVMKFGWKPLGFLKNSNSNSLLNSKTIKNSSQEHAFDSNKSIDIGTISSDIIIQESSDDKINVFLKDFNPDIVTLEVKESRNNVKIETKLKKKLNFKRSDSKLVIELPKDYSKNVSIGSTSGDITNSNTIKSNVLKTSTTSGDIDLQNINGEDMNLSSVSGDIDCTSFLLDTIKISTTSGSIELEDLDAEDVKLNTISGDIDLQIKSGYLSMNTLSGDLDISDVQAKLKNTTIKSKSISAKYLDGVSEYKINTVSGDITITD